jgi:hypothetical protein
LFVTKKPRLLTRGLEVAWLIDTLGMEEVFVEDWIPKARHEGLPFDLRVITIGGEPRHVVGRAHSSPFTNLNLDARRLSRETVAEILGEGWREALLLAEQAARGIPNAYALGLDLLVRPSRRRFVMLEANAFGDYLPKLEFEGASTYEAELRQWLEQTAREAA